VNPRQLTAKQTIGGVHLRSLHAEMLPVTAPASTTAPIATSAPPTPTTTPTTPPPTPPPPPPTSPPPPPTPPPPPPLPPRPTPPPRAATARTPAPAPPPAPLPPLAPLATATTFVSPNLSSRGGVVAALIRTAGCSRFRTIRLRTAVAPTMIAGTTEHVVIEPV